jgi:hypothetical protein
MSDMVRSRSESVVRLVATLAVMTGIGSVIAGLLLLGRATNLGTGFLFPAIGSILGAGMTYLNVARRALGIRPIQVVKGAPITWTTLLWFNVLWLSYMAMLTADSKIPTLVLSALTLLLAATGYLLDRRR